MCWKHKLSCRRNLQCRASDENVKEDGLKWELVNLLRNKYWPHDAWVAVR